MTGNAAGAALLSDAWRFAFGRNPDPEKAYVKAIQAVEATARPKVTPKDQTSQLGKMIGQMRNGGDWSLPFAREREQTKTSVAVLAMVQVLWSGHSDRHPGDHYVPTSQAAAEAAVHLAVPLVQFFYSDQIHRRP